MGLPSLEYRRDGADMVQVYKIINNIDLVDKNKMFYNVRIYWNKRLPVKDL